MSHVLTIAEMVALEKSAIAGGVEAWELMTEAAGQMALAVAQFFPAPGNCRVYAGKGNNAGDAFVLARLLRKGGWQVEVISPFAPTEMSQLAQRAFNQWTEASAGEFQISSSAVRHGSRRPLLVIDGLLGVGATGEVRPPLIELIQEINRARERGAVVVALDLPSGLGNGAGGCVVADHTFAVGFAKQELLADDATAFVGRLSVLPLDALTREYARDPHSSKTVATASSLRHLLPPWRFERHKGQSGRVTLVAGSVGTAGAAVLAATGALRAGAGLVSLYCPPEIYPQLATMLPPEVMARPWKNLADLVPEKMDVLAVGPGLHLVHAAEVLPLLRAAQRAGTPMVLDAGALTILAQEKTLLDELNSCTLLTPHPGEMERLCPQKKGSRAEWAARFVFDHQATLLLKGARTIVAAHGQRLSYNSTGHPGMATGGMGDTLTGVCAALLGAKLSTYDAARVGAWVCGRAAEIAIAEDGQSQESLLPTDLDRCLGRAFLDLRAGTC